MRTSDAIRFALETSDEDMRFIEALRDAPLARANGRGNHAWWTLGHLTWTEGSIHRIVLGGPNATRHLARWFRWGSEPSDDGAGYPAFDDLLAAYRVQRARTMRLLDDLDDAALDRPPLAPPPGLEAAFATVAKVLLINASHQSFHCGEVAAARRSLGRDPFFVPTPAQVDDA